MTMKTSMTTTTTIMKICNNHNDIKRFFSVLEVLSAFRRILTSFWSCFYVGFKFIYFEYTKIFLVSYSYSEYDFHLWSDDSFKGGEERHVVGVHTWCPIESKPRGYVLGNSLTASGSENTSLM